MRYAGLHWTFIPDPAFHSAQTVLLPITIGRLPSNEIVLDLPGSGVSREHARIVWEENRPVLYDLHSTNGTYVDGHQVAKTNLMSGSVLHTGNYKLNFLLLIRCQRDSCKRLINDKEALCPWCGQFVADAMTRHGRIGEFLP